MTIKPGPVQPATGRAMLRDLPPQGPGAVCSGRPAMRPAMRVALVGNYLPRLCGIATYTTHVHTALREHWRDVAVDVYAMVDPGRSYAFPPTVRATIAQEDRDSYRAAARRIAASGADLLWVQHEYGIFGGTAGAYLLDLVDAVPLPLALTLHTVLESPSPDQHRVLARLLDRASTVVVMAERARVLLRRLYRLPAHKVVVIEHGVPDRDYVAPSRMRDRLGWEDRKTVLTFGLLAPGKGLASMIRAMPHIVAHCPEAIYRIVGATHPHLVAQEGERYRESLQALAKDLGVEAHLRWENRFLDEPELLDQIAAADLYVTPYRSAQQITSGTLAYAFALGKPIVSTPYAHASELLAHGRGKLVGFDDDSGLAAAVGDLLCDDGARARMARDAHAQGRAFTWRRMARRLVETFAARLSPPRIGLAPSPVSPRRDPAPQSLADAAA